jgi:enamine deaminase RidA (YjgF/YER057c/UK114 family)
VRTRIFVVDIAANGEAVGRAHREVFGVVAPATGVYGVAGLHRPDLLVEVEATALLGG